MSEGTLEKSSTGGKKTTSKVFGLTAMVLFSISAVFTGDTIASSAGLGVQVLTMVALLGIILLIPYGFITSELGSAWPEEGGITVWIHEAFGSVWGTISTWLYWVNVGIWAPSVFIALIGMFKSGFGIEIPWMVELALVIGIVWLMVAVGVLPLKWSERISSVSAIVKAGSFILVGIAGYVAAIKLGGPANSFEFKNWIPDMQNWSLFPALVYCFLGFELMSSVGDSIENPKRDIPRAIFIAVACIVVVYFFVLGGVLAMIPAGEIDIVSGVTDALSLAMTTLFGSAGPAVLKGITVGLMFAFFGNMVTWSVGANHSMAASGEIGDMPKFFAHKNKKFDSPDYAFYATGVVGTVIAVLAYTVLRSSQDTFWVIVSLTAILLLIPLVMMFPAAVVLKFKYPDKPRPFETPGGKVGIIISALSCEIVCVTTLLLFFFEIPEGMPSGQFYAITIGGTVLAIFVGFLLHLWRLRQQKDTTLPSSRQEHD